MVIAELRACGAPWVRKCGNPSVREIVVKLTVPSPSGFSPLPRGRVWAQFHLISI